MDVTPDWSRFYLAPDHGYGAIDFLAKGEVVIYEDLGEWFYVWYMDLEFGNDAEGRFPKVRIEEGGTVGIVK